MNTFGDKLNYLRKRKQKTQEEIAVAIGTTKSTISKYERNIVEPTLESARKIAEYFMVSLDWLAGEDRYEPVRQNIPAEVYSSYIEVIIKAISQDITADNLNEAIEFISKLKENGL